MNQINNQLLNPNQINPVYNQMNQLNNQQININQTKLPNNELINKNQMINIIDNKNNFINNQQIYNKNVYSINNQMNIKFNNSTPINNFILQQNKNNYNQKSKFILENNINNNKNTLLDDFSTNESYSSVSVNPTSIEELNNLSKYNSAMCKIISPVFGTGFFCDMDNMNFPFKKALFTAYHVLDENNIENNKEIKFEYLNKTNTITMKENRRRYTDEELDYTCIEIFDTDNINNFFKIDTKIFDNKIYLKNKGIFILQFPKGDKICLDSGIILDINNSVIQHNVPTKPGSSGSPLINRDNNIILGIHIGSLKDEKILLKYGLKVKKLKSNIGIPFDIIIKDIKDKLSNKNIINLIYKKTYNSFDYGYR